MVSQPQEHTRAAAVAGFFYPRDPHDLERVVHDLVDRAEATVPPPKAVIVPHAGYVYSVRVAAAAYAVLRSLKGKLARVVLAGPSHYVGFRGIAVPRADAFSTPLGPVAVDTEAVAALVRRGLAHFDDRAHRDEHALEVQLPFLREAVGDIRLVPLLAGEAGPDDVAAALEAVWGGPETLIVISSDLSHFHPLETARRMDAATAGAIEAFDGTRLSPDDACGFLPIAGLLAAAGRCGLSITRLALGTSVDGGGPPERVVGYGAWALTEVLTAPRGGD